MTAPNIHPNHQTILEKYLEWFCTPPMDRLPDEKTQCMVADKLGVNRRTLHMWERMPYFKEQVSKLTNLDRACQTEKVKQALYEKALTGDAQAIKLYKEWLAGVNEKIDLNVDGKMESTVTRYRLLS